MDYFQLVCAIGAVLLALYYYYTSTFDYWKIRNIVGPRPTVLVGNLGEILLRKMSISDKLKQMYNEYKNEPVFGMFEGMKPVLVINDLDLIKDVLIKDFSLFVDRGFPMHPKAEPLSEHLFALEEERWRPMRTKLSPIFTSGKLKEMVLLMLECSKNLERYVEKVARAGKPVECRDLAAKFTTDVIGSCAFGINMNAIEDERSEFREIGKKLFEQTPRMQARDLCRQFLPNFYNLFGSFLQPPGVDQFLTDVITDTIKYRKENNIARPDFVNALMEIQDHPEKLENIKLTPSFIAAQAFVFFTAGFETSSTTMSHALYELAQNQDVQDKLRKEIREVYEKHGGEITYDTLKEMKYLEKVFKEVLRMYPLLSMLTREVSENYTFKGTKITIEKGMTVWIPVYGIQRDPNIYPDPDKFDPERFNEDAIASRHPMSFLSFGNGPRNCIGARFAYSQSKIGLATILRNYKVDVCEKTKIPYESDPYLFLLTPRDGVHLKITKVEN